MTRRSGREIRDGGCRGNPELGAGGGCLRNPETLAMSIAAMDLDILAGELRLFLNQKKRGGP